MLGRRALDDDAGDAGVGVQGADGGVQLFLGDALGEVPLLEGDPRLGGPALLVADVELHRGGVADGDGDQLGLPSGLGQLGRLLLHVGDDLVGHRPAAQGVGIFVRHGELLGPGGGEAGASGALAGLLR